MRQHLRPGGVILIEPWLTPAQWKEGHLGAVFVNQPTLKLARMHQSGAAEDGVSVLHFHYLVATEAGVEYFTERLELGLFTHEEYLGAFQASGLQVIHEADPNTLMGRGISIGVLRKALFLTRVPSCNLHAHRKNWRKTLI